MKKCTAEVDEVSMIKPVGRTVHRQRQQVPTMDDDDT